ncbi:ATP-binding protein [Nocardia vinacea]|uniref:ATP-binding protein n=1 Tax=Nocardia vinacea TaxID=96468 RepID=UPI002E0D2974|nr:ATP-binding protein [Nocardia vinacea]
MTTVVPAKSRRKKNPYVGPRAFRSDEVLYGRERERRELTDLLIAERIVLLHSPSGAGKTSLIQAGVIPALTREGFSVSRTLRVNAFAPEPVANRWVYSVALALVGEDRLDDCQGLEQTTLTDVLERLDSEQPSDTERVLIFDQFEEILNLDPTDWDGQREFFEQLGAALTNAGRWALFSMREDFIGGLEPFLRYIPGRLRTRYRLDFLQHDSALRAIQEPARDYDGDFSDEGAEQLFADLARVRVECPGGVFEERVGLHVEPVQLQVACHRLWRALRRDRSGVVGSITAADVEKHADIDTTLAGFYSDAISDVVTETGTDERALRDWFDSELITEKEWRSQSRSGPKTGPAEVSTVLAGLEDRYLIRSDRRAGVIWYELTHDRLVTPVIRSNRKWRRINLHPIEYRASVWSRKDRDDSYLLSREELAEARLWLFLHRNDVGDVERQFIERSRQRNGQAILRSRLAFLVVILFILNVMELITIILLVTP